MDIKKNENKLNELLKEEKMELENMAKEAETSVSDANKEAVPEPPAPQEDKQVAPEPPVPDMDQETSSETPVPEVDKQEVPEPPAPQEDKQEVPEPPAPKTINEEAVEAVFDTDNQSEVKKPEKPKVNDDGVDYEKIKAEIDSDFAEEGIPSSDLQEEIVLSNNKSYYILDRITYNKEFYLLLVCAEDDDHGTLIQKEVLENNQLKLKPLTSEEEFREVLKRFSEKSISP